MSSERISTVSVFHPSPNHPDNLSITAAVNKYKEEISEEDNLKFLEISSEDEEKNEINKPKPKSIQS